MTTQTTEEQWHIVCGNIEVEELELRGDIWLRQATDNELFDLIRYPNQKIYSGNWGPEPLHFYQHSMTFGHAGSVFCSYNRYKEIAAWFLDTMFRP